MQYQLLQLSKPSSLTKTQGHKTKKVSTRLRQQIAKNSRTAPATLRKPDSVKLGEAEITIERLNVQISQLAKRGLFVLVETHGASMFSMSVNLMELGVPEESKRAQSGRFRSTMYDLIDPEVRKGMRNLLDRARYLIDGKYGIDVRIARPFRFVSSEAIEALDELGNTVTRPSHLDQFLAEIEGLQQELNAYVKEHLLDPYDALLHRAIDGFIEVAREAWTAIKKEVPEWLVTLEEFEEQARGTIMKRFPTAERVRDDIRIEVRLSEIFHSAELMRMKRKEEQERTVLQQAQAERETAQRLTVEAMRDRQIAEMETGRQAAVVKAKMQAEQDAAYEAELEQKRHWAMLQLAQQLSAEDSPLMDILQHVREFTERFANQAISAIEKKGALDNGMQRRIREYILDFRSWDVSSEAGDDQALKAIVAELEGNLAAAEIKGLLKTLKHLKNVAATPGQILAGMETRLAMTKPKTWRTICRACKKFGHAHTYEPPASCPHCGVGEGEITAYEVQA